MIPMISHGSAGDKGYTLNDFEARFLQICSEHRKDNRALAFAFILWDFTHPHVTKVLKDPDYWNALDEISGRYLSVFSFHTRPSKGKRKARQYEQQSDVISYMVKVHTDVKDSERSLLERYFDLEDGIKLPAVLFFQVSNEEIIGTHLVQLQSEKIEDSFLEIRNILSVAAASVSEVVQENYANSPEIFALIKKKLEDRGLRLWIKKGYEKAMQAKKLFSLVG